MSILCSALWTLFLKLRSHWGMNEVAEFRISTTFLHLISEEAARRGHENTGWSGWSKTPSRRLLGAQFYKAQFRILKYLHFFNLWIWKVSAEFAEIIGSLPRRLEKHISNPNPTRVWSWYSSSPFQKNILEAWALILLRGIRQWISLPCHRDGKYEDPNKFDCKVARMCPATRGGITQPRNLQFPAAPVCSSFNEGNFVLHIPFFISFFPHLAKEVKHVSARRPTGHILL